MTQAQFYPLGWTGLCEVHDFDGVWMGCDCPSHHCWVAVFAVVRVSTSFPAVEQKNMPIYIMQEQQESSWIFQDLHYNQLCTDFATNMIKVVPEISVSNASHYAINCTHIYVCMWTYLHLCAWGCLPASVCFCVCVMCACVCLFASNTYAWVGVENFGFTEKQKNIEQGSTKLKELHVCIMRV